MTITPQNRVQSIRSNLTDIANQVDALEAELDVLTKVSPLVGFIADHLTEDQIYVFYTFRPVLADLIAFLQEDERNPVRTRIMKLYRDGHRETVDMNSVTALGSRDQVVWEL